MEKGLKEIRGVQGVRGCWVCDNQGAVFVSDPPEGFDQERLEKINRRGLQALIAVEAGQDPAEELDLSFWNSRLLIRDYQQYVLVILCEPEVNVSLVRLSANVVTNQWETDDVIQQRIKKHDQVRTTA